MTRPKVKDVAKRLHDDIDPDKCIDVRELDGHINKMVAAGTEALKVQSSSFPDVVRSLVSRMFEGLRFTHEAIRELVAKGSKDPRSVDGLSLSRLQLESLYAISLILERPEYGTSFAKYGWKKLYISYLMEREECLDLPRFKEFLDQKAPNILNNLRILSGVTDEERITIDIEELGITPPLGFTSAPIKPFPLPSKIIDLVQDLELKSSLQRLYPDYEYLCSFAHSSVEATLLKTFMDPRSQYRHALPTDPDEVMFRNRVAQPAISYSFLSVAQCCAELTKLYPSNVELAAKVAQGWEWLIDQSLLGRSIWERRTKKLLNLI
jgi:hypothetical protein